EPARVTFLDRAARPALLRFPALVVRPLLARRAEIPAGRRRRCRRGTRCEAARPRAARTGTRGTATGTEASGPLLAGARLADRQIPPHEGLLVEAVDGFFGDSAIEELDERESPGAACLSVDRDDDVRGLADGREMRPQISLGRPVWHVADEQTYSH